MKTVIMAGGKGTRIASVAGHIPKPMIPILEKPIQPLQAVISHPLGGALDVAC